MKNNQKNNKEDDNLIEEFISKNAYYAWLNAGCPEGKDKEFWELGERRLWNWAGSNETWEYIDSTIK